MPLASPSLTFLSYSHEDQEFALRLAKQLKELGVPIWADVLDLQPGDRWDKAITDALNKSLAVIVILSPSSVKSAHVLGQTQTALEQVKALIPVMYKDCDVPYNLRSFQYADFRTDYSAGLNQLLRAFG